MLVKTAEWTRVEDARDLAQAQLTANALDLNRPRSEAAPARAQNWIKVAGNL